MPNCATSGVLRGSSTDKVSFEEFVEAEKREMHSTNEHEQNLSACIASADHSFMNNGTLEELHETLTQALQQQKSDA